jgi:hypothetical protein
MSIEAMRQALEFIQATNRNSSFLLVPESNLNKVILALRQSIEQAEQAQPVAWRFDHKDGQGYCYYDERWPAEFIPQDATPLYL